MGEVKKAVGYIRVSTKSQGESGVGLACQTDEIKSAARNSGYFVEQVFEDTHTGRGKRSALQRPGLQDAIKLNRPGFAESGLFNARATIPYVFGFASNESFAPSIREIA